MNKYVVWHARKKVKHYSLYIPKIVRAEDECIAIYKYVCFIGGLPLHKSIEEFREFYNKNGAGYFRCKKIYNSNSSDEDEDVDDVEEAYEQAMKYYKNNQK